MPESAEILAKWNYPADLWRDFVEFESSVYRKSVRSALYFIYGTIIGALVLITLVSVIPYFVIRKWDSSIWGPAFGIAFIAMILVVCGVIVWLMRREKMKRFRAKTGDAVITRSSSTINGVDFLWHFEGRGGWRYLGGERKWVDAGIGKRLQILELNFVACIPDSDSPTWDTGEWRLPVEPGKVAEADRILKRLDEELAASEAKWLIENAALGHDLTGKECRRCESPLYKIVMHSRKCRG